MAAPAKAAVTCSVPGWAPAADSGSDEGSVCGDGLADSEGALHQGLGGGSGHGFSLGVPTMSAATRLPCVPAVA